MSKSLVLLQACVASDTCKRLLLLFPELIAYAHTSQHTLGRVRESKFAVVNHWHQLARLTLAEGMRGATPSHAVDALAVFGCSV